MTKINYGSLSEPRNVADIGGLLRLDPGLVNHLLLRHDQSWRQFESALSDLSVVPGMIDLILSQLDRVLGRSAEDEAARADLLGLKTRWERTFAASLQGASLVGQADFADLFTPAFLELRHTEREEFEALLEFATALVADDGGEEALLETE